MATPIDRFQFRDRTKYYVTDSISYEIESVMSMLQKQNPDVYNKKIRMAMIRLQMISDPSDIYSERPDDEIMVMKVMKKSFNEIQMLKYSLIVHKVQKMVDNLSPSDRKAMFGIHPQ